MKKLIEAILLSGLVTGCGLRPTKDSKPPHPIESNADATPLLFPGCRIQKSDRVFANSVAQTLYGRNLLPEEFIEADGDDLDRSAFVSKALTEPAADYGFSLFLANLFQLSNIKVDDTLEDEELVKDSVLVAHLQQEPIELFLRNKDKTWPWFFQTQEILCTRETAEIYDFPLYEGSGFRHCSLPANRAGFLGLASVLRAVPSDFVSVNNNYKRVAFALYLAQGMRLLAATNGPKGEGIGEPLPSCVPVRDMRSDPEGLAFGTARIPMEGATCAGCHSPHNGPLSIAFRHFRADGKTFRLSDIDELNREQRLGHAPEYLQEILNESDSCWAAKNHWPAQQFQGQPGLARLIVGSETLGSALAVQIPQMLGNVEATTEMREAIGSSYESSGKTLQGAIKGYFLSETFQCAALASP